MQKIRVIQCGVTDIHPSHPLLPDKIRSGEVLNVREEVYPELFRDRHFKVEFLNPDMEMEDIEPCGICGMSAKVLPSHFDGIHQKCWHCGEFKLTGRAQHELSQNRDAEIQRKISGWVSDQNRNATVPKLSPDVIKQVTARSLPSIAERADRLLLEALRLEQRLGDVFDISQPRFVRATYSQDQSEVAFLAGVLMEQDWIKKISNDYQVRHRGYIAADKFTRPVTRSDKGFVAMWFDENLNVVYDEGFQIGILNAGYEPVRVDRVEHTNRIDDEIISQIRTAAFVVADFTGHRGGVYFEAGFALGLNIPVIWTCSQDDMKDLHFDIRQFNTIDWQSPEKLAKDLQHRIEATVGKGPRASATENFSGTAPHE